MRIDDTWTFCLKHKREKSNDPFRNLRREERSPKTIDAAFAVKGTDVVRITGWYSGGLYPEDEVFEGDLVNPGRLYNQILKQTGQNFRFDESSGNLVPGSRHTRTTSASPQEITYYLTDEFLKAFDY